MIDEETYYAKEQMEFDRRMVENFHYNASGKLRCRGERYAAMAQEESNRLAHQKAQKG